MAILDTNFLQAAKFIAAHTGLSGVLTACSAGGGENGGVVEKGGKFFLNKKIDSLVDAKLRFVISSEGNELGEVELKNGFMIESSYKYSLVNQGRLNTYSGPETECIGFDKDALVTHPDDKGTKEYFLLCRALESYTGKYRSYTSTAQRSVAIDNNQLFFLSATGKSGPLYRTYYDVKVKR